jgi:hypothetical protein
VKIKTIAAPSSFRAEVLQWKRGIYTWVHDINDVGDIVEGETRNFENEGDAMNYVYDRVPVGEAFVVLNQHEQVATFGSKRALRKGGWLR